MNPFQKAATVAMLHIQAPDDVEINWALDILDAIGLLD